MTACHSRYTGNEAHCHSGTWIHFAHLPNWPTSRRAWAMIRWLALLAIGICACSSAQTKRRVDGSYAIDCNSQKVCLDRAAKLCGESGYTIVGGRHDQKIYGVPGNQKVVGKDELYIRCNKDKIPDAPDPAAGSWKLERPDAASPSPHAKEMGKASACRPGETQRCVGAGACVGGQACEADGSRFGPCDCGESLGSESKNVAPRDAGP